MMKISKVIGYIRLFLIGVTKRKLMYGYLCTPKLLIGLNNIKFPNKCRILMGARIECLGKGVISFGENFRCGHDLFISTSDAKVIIGDNAVFASNIYLGTHVYDFTVPKIGDWFDHYVDERDIIIGDGVFVGMNAVILPGTIIGDGAVIGANSVVSGKIEQNEKIYCRTR